MIFFIMIAMTLPIFFAVMFAKMCEQELEIKTLNLEIKKLQFKLLEKRRR